MNAWRGGNDPRRAPVDPELQPHYRIWGRREYKQEAQKRDRPATDERTPSRKRGEAVRLEIRSGLSGRLDRDANGAQTR